MRVLIINTSERTGGAAVAASRLMDALINNGIKAKMLVRDKQTNKPSVVKLDYSWKLSKNFLFERFVIWLTNRFNRKNLFMVDIANCGTDITNLPEFRQADVIHLHYINQGMLSLKGLKKILDSGKSVVWTMHDMWPCTGICHYSNGCYNYEVTCHNCAYLYNGGSKRDLSHRVFNKKKELYKGHKITFVGCSRWIAEEARKSSLFDKQVVTSIPNPINTNLYKPGNKNDARIRFVLPKDKKLILFGSVKITDKRKGMKYFVEACRLLIEKYPEMRDQLGVVVFGTHSAQMESLLPFPVYAQNYVESERELIELYNAVDLAVTPSLEDNLPNIIMEAMACGIPCVGFQVGGIPQMIDHLHNGYVAKYKSAEDFANGIYWTLKESEYPSLSEEARRKVVTNYAENIVVKQYIGIYNKITGKDA